MSDYKTLKVWQKSIELVKEIYELTDIFPKKEQFSLVDQMRRAAISIPSNIAEGSQRNSTPEFIRFLYISKSSAAELETQLIISLELQYISKKNYNDIEIEVTGIQKMLYNLVQKLKTQNETHNS